MSGHLLTFALLSLLLASSIKATNNMVQILNEAQLVTSSTLIWDSFTGEEDQLKYAVVAGHFVIDADTRKPMYVCRLSVDGLMTTGHMTKHQEKWVCVVPIHTSVQTHYAFDILVNIKKGAKLTWQPWNKFSRIPVGAVSVVSTGHVSNRKSVILKMSTDCLVCLKIDR